MNTQYYGQKDISIIINDTKQVARLIVLPNLPLSVSDKYLFYKYYKSSKNTTPSNMLNRWQNSVSQELLRGQPQKLSGVLQAYYISFLPQAHNFSIYEGFILNNMVSQYVLNKDGIIKTTSMNTIINPDMSLIVGLIRQVSNDTSLEDLAKFYLSLDNVQYLLDMLNKK